MNDTSHDMEKRYRALLMQRTGEERLMMGCAIWDTARALLEASLLERDPRASAKILRQGVFLRFYGHEFDSETRLKILVAIEQTANLIPPSR